MGMAAIWELPTNEQTTYEDHLSHCLNNGLRLLGMIFTRIYYEGGLKSGVSDYEWNRK
jgi:hypothetical protein